VKKSFDGNGISIPFPQVTYHGTPQVVALPEGFVDTRAKEAGAATAATVAAQVSIKNVKGSAIGLLPLGLFDMPVDDALHFCQHLENADGVFFRHGATRSGFQRSGKQFGFIDGENPGLAGAGSTIVGLLALPLFARRCLRHRVRCRSQTVFPARRAVDSAIRLQKCRRHTCPIHKRSVCSPSRNTGCMQLKG
jgi:hypothetical protein